MYRNIIWDASKVMVIGFWRTVWRKLCVFLCRLFLRMFAPKLWGLGLVLRLYYVKLTEELHYYVGTDIWRNETICLCWFPITYGLKLFSLMVVLCTCSGFRFMHLLYLKQVYSGQLHLDISFGFFILH